MFARCVSITKVVPLTRVFGKRPAPQRRPITMASATASLHQGQIKVAHILMPTEKIAELDALYEQIVSERSTLAELASKHSTCPSAQNGGVIGWIGKGQTVAPFEDTVFSTPIGSVARCDTSFGSHLVEVLASRDAPKPVLNVSVQDLGVILETQELNDINLIDVREQNEWDGSCISKFTLKPLSGIREWSATASEDFDPKKPTYVLCAAGVRSAQAAQVLVGEGFEEVYNVVGGMYAAAGVNGLVD